MNRVGDIISKGEYKSSLLHVRKFKAKCTKDQFIKLFIEAATSRMFGNSFKVDDNNRETINQLFYFLVNSDKFEGDLNRGIIIMGNIGNGKTVIMESFIDVFNATSDKVITSIHAKDVARLTSEMPIGHYNKRPLFIDDIGKEQDTIKVYGTIQHPMEDLINERYKNFALTFMTSNYKYENMAYPKHATDRLRQMMNKLVLKGESRRK